MRLKKCDLCKTSVLLGLVVLLLYLPLKAQECRVVERNDDGLTLVFESGEISSKTVKTDGRLFSELLMEGFGSSSVKGAPRLPVMSKMVPAPVCSGVSVSVVDSEFAEYDCAALGLDFDLLPSQGSVPKSSPRPAFYINDSIYHIDSYYSLPLVSVSDRGVYRDVSLAGLTFSPVSYNPVSRRVRVCTRALVKVSFNGVDKEETTRISRHSSSMFGIDSEMLASSDEPLRDEYTSSPISYLIVAHSMFRQNQDLQEFVEWKKKLGYIVKIAYTDDPGVGTSRNSIKNYIKDCFDNATE
ncbi:MAG: C25 family peptidase propeptide domain-containing protein, partial [Bacteroidales bacterium]|nr:C25 family peptidase propeptide domain-containing protein [Bacteroidales bacterium]